MGIIEVKE